MRPRRPVNQPRRTLVTKPSNPPVSALPRHPELRRDMRYRATITDDPLDEKQPPADVQPRITVRHETSWP